MECVRSYTLDKSDSINYIDESVIFGGILYNHFGHFITDSFARLWWVVKYNAYNKKIIFISDGIVNKKFLSFLTNLGIPLQNIIVVDKPTQFRAIHVPEQAYYPYTGFYSEFQLAYNKIVSTINNEVKSPYKKIYLSRTAYPKYDMFNEEYFENFYRQHGFQIIYPEQHSIEQQIAFVAGAEEIVTTIGTLSHLACFAKPESKLILLIRSRAHFNPVQEMINQAKNLDYCYVDVSCNFLPHNKGGSNNHIFYLAPTKMWKLFIQNEYGIDDDGEDLYQYFDNNPASIGSYINAWQNLYKQEFSFKSIFSQNAINVLDNIEESINSNETDFNLSSNELINSLSRKSKLYKRLVGKSFTFSRMNGNFARKMRLSEGGIIDNLNNNGHFNEFSWEIHNDILVFKNKNGHVSSKYPIIQNKNDKLEILGYFKSNPELLFKLIEFK